MMHSYQLYFKCIDEWIPAIKVIADERIPYTIDADNINDAIVKAIKNIKGIKLDQSNKLICNETNEIQVF